MTYNREVHHRHSIRLRDYDYSQAGAYFVTLCTHKRACLLGQIVSGAMQLSAIGHCALSQWQRLVERFQHLQLDAFVIMPNHIHGVLQFQPMATADGATARVAPTVGAPLAGAPSAAAPFAGVQTPGTQNNATSTTLGAVVGAYKSLVLHQALGIAKQDGIYLGQLWQRNYWEHVVRNEDELQRIRDYIVNNPQQWELDQLYVAPLENS